MIIDPESTEFQSGIQRLEPLIPIALSIHGALLLQVRYSDPWQVILVAITALLGVIGLAYRLGTVGIVLRATYICLAAWLLMLTLGGTESFFLFWYFGLLATYPMMFHQRYALGLVIFAALTFTVLYALIPVQIPLLAILTRTFLLLFIGWMVNALGMVIAGYARRAMAAEKHTREQFHLMLALMNSLPDAIYVKDTQSRFIVANEATARLMGAKSGRDLIGKTDKDFYGTLRAADYHADEQAVIDTGLIMFNHADQVYDHELGRDRWHSSTKAPVRDDDGNVIGIVGISRDLTLIKQAEEQRLEAERLRIQMEKDKELLELREHFISVVSHEFRTPLSVITLACDLLLRYETLPVESRQQKTRQIRTQAQYMTGLLDEFLMIRKAQSGKSDFKPETLDLIAFCQDIVEQLRSTLQPGQELTFSAPEQIEQAQMDPQLLRHILMNLLSNAIKYSPDGGQIRLELSSSGGEAIFRISDQGMGIPADDVKRLFEPFHRGRNVGKIRGTGIGLTIVKENIDLYNGSIEVSSTEKVGTTFTVRLPLHPPV